jgi:hypothetical protein
MTCTKLLIVEVITRKGGSRLETEVNCLYDEVLTLKVAIEEAIIKGQKAFGALTDTVKPGMTRDEELELVDVSGGSGLVGWVDDI